MTDVSTMPSDGDYFFADDADEMPDPSSRRIVTPWTVAFAALVLAGLGFVAGIQMEKRQGDSAANVALPRGFSPVLSGGPSGQVPAAGPRAGGDATIGEVKLVDGDTVYVTTADGTTVKVTTTPDSEVTTMADGTVADLDVGDTVIVQGETSDDGTVAASRISEAGGLGGGTTNPG
ncbi:MAG TPA: hypothetical protein VFP09_07730 [Desertimonas sp.]|nr:hypothetical protein [Desertimonas sp.]